MFGDRFIIFKLEYPIFFIEKRGNPDVSKFIEPRVWDYKKLYINKFRQYPYSQTFQKEKLRSL